MSITIEELIRNLTESGLLSSDELNTVHASVLRRSGSASPEKVARELVRQKHLTKLQAAAVLKGKTKNLVFGDYIVLDKIGSGGMGQVFKARHKPTAKLVAVKVLSADAVKNRRLIERFKKEAKAVARLKHPNVVRAYEAGKINRVRYLVMELVEGENMLERVKRKGPLPVDECVSCVLQAARGLNYAHEKGIIHRDIKPSNLLRNRRNGRVKILDMGLARVEEPEEDDELRLTMPGQMLGTARFMAPEQIEDARKADVRSDVYSLGCTLHFILRAKAPYSGETVAHTLMAHVSAPIPDLCRKRTDVPQWLGDVFQKMLCKNPRQRFQTMAELVQVIQYHLGEELTKHDGHVLDEDAEGEEDEYSKLLAKRDIGASLEFLYVDPDDAAVDSNDKDFEPPVSDILKGVVLEDDEIPTPRQAGFTQRTPQSDISESEDDRHPAAGSPADDGAIVLNDLGIQPDSIQFSAAQLNASEVDFALEPGQDGAPSGAAADAPPGSDAFSAHTFRLGEPAPDAGAEEIAALPDATAGEIPRDSASSATATRESAEEGGSGSAVDYVKDKLKGIRAGEAASSRQALIAGGVGLLVIAIAAVIWFLTR